MSTYPKWIYHEEKEAKLVQSKEEHQAAGKDWAEVPFEAEEKPKKKSKETKE